MLINGKTGEQISVTDRGLQYGDGLFETIAVRDGRPCHWRRHMERLHSSCQRMNIPEPDSSLLYVEVLKEIGDSLQGVIKITITRGPGGRGYNPPAKPTPTRIVSWGDTPIYPAKHYQQGIVARLCATRLGWNPTLAGMKHLNRLEQVLARSEWNDSTIQEGLMMDSAGCVIEGTCTNLFVMHADRIYTPDLSRCGVAGVMQGIVLGVAATLDIPVIVGDLALQDVWSADALFVTNSLIGIWPVRELSGHAFDITSIPKALSEGIMNEAFAHD